jgi:hypothetical protein
MRWLVLLALAGCYSPNPPSGAYLCGVGNACPSSQSCVCGQCVRKAEDAACAFTVDATQGGMSPTVTEHQSFPVKITALQMDATTPASGYQGTVELSFRLPDGSKWCDVTPSTATLQNGSATVTLSLNRETIPPQTPLLTATGPGGAAGSTGKVVVTAPSLTKDADPIVAPVRPASPFGWAANNLYEPVVLRDPGGGFRMYFSGSGPMSSGLAAIGVATSTDGKSFSAKPSPVMLPAAGSFYSLGVFNATAYPTSSGWTMLFAGANMLTAAVEDVAQIGVATSSDGLGTFAVGNGGNPVIHNGQSGQADCNYCNSGVEFPSVVTQPQVGDGGTPSSLILFFSAHQMGNLDSIGRATQSGDAWVPEPSPVLEGDLGGEAILLAPTVLLDGSVFKMWYSFARLADVKMNAQFCDIPVEIGYATSSDGLYWVRSPSNKNALGMTASGWDAGIKTLISGSVLTQGADASSGFMLYYTTVRHVNPLDMTSMCEINGIGRATRP